MVLFPLPSTQLIGIADGLVCPCVLAPDIHRADLGCRFFLKTWNSGYNQDIPIWCASRSRWVLQGLVLPAWDPPAGSGPHSLVSWDKPLRVSTLLLFRGHRQQLLPPDSSRFIRKAALELDVRKSRGDASKLPCIDL